MVDEYISRKAVLDVATDWCPDDDGSVGKTGDMREMLDELEAIPAADVRPVVRGKWEPVVSANEDGSPYQAGIHCSECGHFDVWEFNFCPNCGADMREG